jgi:hypothetical protein
MNIKLFLLTAFAGLNFSLNAQQLNVNQNLASELTSEFAQVENPIEYARQESKNGSMNFDDELQNEKGMLFLFEKVAYNKDDFKILLWGIAAKKINISSFKLARTTYEQIHNLKLKGPDLNALKNGYNSVK